jgi:nicotinate-nucleotide pyrophosphorylase (carboxylating)
VRDPFDHPAVLRLVRLALEEDLGRGDWTTRLTVPEDGRAEGRIVAREGLVVAGLPIVNCVLRGLRAEAEAEFGAAEGERVEAGRGLATLRGRAADLLAAERVTLNFLQRMCGVATLTRSYVEAIAGSQARIADTRKTVPGWRLLDKYAVRIGGGTNHRFGLDDGILIKDNHVAVCGGVAEAVRRARERAPHLARIEVECETLEEVDEALEAGADAILLDNMDVARIAEAVRRVAGRARIEASGRMSLERARQVAAVGVDLISVGQLTHSVQAPDIAFELSR